jgi:hypothetical protein
MTTIVMLLLGIATCASLAVLTHSFRHALSISGELRHALETCPERKICRVTQIELVATRLPAEPQLLRPLRRPARPQPQSHVLRAAA